jgi:hypothetical protein
LQVNGKLRYEVGVVGFLREEQSCFPCRHARQRTWQISFSFEHIIDSGDPKAFAVALNGERFIPQKSNATFSQSCRDKISTIPVIVIAEDGTYRDTLPTGNHIRTGLREASSGWTVRPSDRTGNKIPGERNQVRLK